MADVGATFAGKPRSATSLRRIPAWKSRPAMATSGDRGITTAGQPVSPSVFLAEHVPVRRAVRDSRREVLTQSEREWSALPGDARATRL